MQEARAHGRAEDRDGEASHIVSLTSENSTPRLEDLKSPPTDADTNAGSASRSISPSELASRNHRSVPNNLAAEILGLIFTELANMFPLDFRFTFGPQSLGWVVVTHVSHRWRDVALNYAALWADLTFNMGPAFAVFVERSKDSPLTVTIRWSADCGEQCWPYIVANFYRVRSLSVSNLFDLSLVGVMLKGRLPALRELSVFTYDSAHNSPFELHTDFLCNITPNIVQLRLEHMGFPAGASTSLRSLQLFRSDSSPAPLLYTFDDVVRTLRQLPALEALTLEYILPSTAMDHNAQPISFPRLKKGILADAGSLSIELYHVLRVPPTADIEVVSRNAIGSNPPVNTHSVLRLWTTFIRTLVADDNPPISLSFHRSTFQAVQRSSISLGVKLFGTPEIVIAPDIDEGYTPRSFNLLIDDLERDVWEGLLLPATPMQSVKHIRLTTFIGEPSLDYIPRSLLDTAKSVTSLDLVGSSALPALIYLTPIGRGPTLLPSLDELQFERVDCHSKTRCGDVLTTVIEALNHALDERYRRKLFLSSITFKSCGIEPSSLAHLRAPGKWGGQTWVNWTWQ
ncbi:hypothetical protein PENSPDRAFT_446565 [Peniophora sp. CONT]|nr:hypothetical protein PENSPDRAFT_446565 [Peniophora sp. CONT]